MAETWYDDGILCGKSELCGIVWFVRLYQTLKSKLQCWNAN